MATAPSLDVNSATRLDTNKRETTGSSKLGKDEFMKLLISQLKNQDPTSPADSTAFVAQLAQFSTLEAMQNSNTSLEKLIVGQTKSQKNDVAAFVGRDVLFKGDGIVLETDRTTSVALAEPNADASAMTAVISDENGKTIRTLDLGAHSAGLVQIKWDGRDDKGNLAIPGHYAIAVAAVDNKGQALGVDQYRRGRVTGVALDSDQPSLMLGDERLNLSDVIEIQERSTQ